MIQLRTFSFFTVLCALALLVFGAVVHNSGSALSCPDWPLCYVSGDTSVNLKTWISIGHRSMASFVGLLTIFLGVIAGKARSEKLIEQSTFKLCIGAIFLVFLQGLIGAITVYYELPTIVSTAHLILSLIFFSVLIKIYHESPSAISDYSIDSSVREKLIKIYNPSLKDGMNVVLFLVFIQVILGGVLRHTGAGLSCGTSIDHGILCQPVGSENWVFWPAQSAAQFHMIHRMMAYVTGFAVILVCVKSIIFSFQLKRIHHPLNKSFFHYPLALIMTIGLQIVLGYQAVDRALAIIPTTLHLVLGVLALSIPWWMSLEFGKMEKEVSPITPLFSFIRDIFELTKPRLGLLVMSTVLVGLFLNYSSISFIQPIFAIILIGLVVASATSLNCYIERDIDKNMERTKMRALPSGRMKPKIALIFGWSLFFIAIPGLYFFINPATAILGLAAHLIYLYAYTPLKSVSPLAVYMGAIPGAIPPVMGWTIVSGQMDLMAWSLFGILFVWQIPHFMAISIYYAKDYSDGAILVYPNTRGKNWTNWSIFLWTALLYLISLTPLWIIETTLHFKIAAHFLNIVFLIISLGGLLLKLDDESHNLWARIYFFASIIWLPLFLGAMIFLRPDS